MLVFSRPSSRVAVPALSISRTLACAFALLSAVGCGDDGGTAQLTPDSGEDSGNTEPAPDAATIVPCGAHASRAADGRACVCETGYAGTACESCAPGFELSGQSCVRIVEQDAGLSCPEASCGLHASCSNDVGYCVCDTGYGGDGCSECAAGYHLEADTCVVDQECLETTCAGAGTCIDASGAPVCDCAEGYAGEHCAGCADDYRADGDLCLAFETCEPNSCTGHGACVDTSGVVSCSCSVGYVGASCAACAVGFVQDSDGACQIFIPSFGDSGTDASDDASSPSNDAGSDAADASGPTSDASAPVSDASEPNIDASAAPDANTDAAPANTTPDPEPSGSAPGNDTGAGDPGPAEAGLDDTGLGDTGLGDTGMDDAGGLSDAAG